MEDIHDCRQGETSGGGADPAEDVKTNPQAPGEPVGEVGGSPQSMKEAHVGGIGADGQNQNQHGSPESEFGEFLKGHFSTPKRLPLVRSPWSVVQSPLNPHPYPCQRGRRAEWLPRNP